jgi:hypothetical protein
VDEITVLKASRMQHKEGKPYDVVPHQNIRLAGKKKCSCCNYPFHLSVSNTPYDARCLSRKLEI